MCDSVSKAKALIDWLRAKGGYFHRSAYVKLDGNTGLSVFTNSEIGPDERLVSCPFDVAITSDLASQAICEVAGVEPEQLVWPAQSSKSGEMWNERMKIGAYLSLHWVYKDKPTQAWPPALAHRTYLDSLPPPSDLTTPLYFNDSELELLRGSNLLGAVEDRRKEWSEEAEVIRNVLKDDGLTWERYLAIATYMSSRAFPSRILRLPENGGSATHEANDEEISQPVLLPGVDLFNHARHQPILWLSSLTPSSAGTATPSISLVSAQSTESDSQLFNNYGAKPNEELLLGYGFVLDPNPDDVVILRLGTTQPTSTVTDRLQANGLDAGKRFELRRDGEMDQDLLEVVRIMLNPEAGNSHHRHDGSDEEDDDGHAAHAKEEKEMQLELDVLGMLGGMLDDKLEKLRVSVEPGTGVRKEIKRMTEVYRQGQNDILNAAMDKLAERIERIEGLLDEGMGGCPCGC